MGMRDGEMGRSEGREKERWRMSGFHFDSSKEIFYYLERTVRSEGSLTLPNSFRGKVKGHI